LIEQQSSVTFHVIEIKENGMTGLRLTDFTCYAQVLSDLHTALDIPSQGPPTKDILGVSCGVVGG